MGSTAKGSVVCVFTLPSKERTGRVTMRRSHWTICTARPAGHLDAREWEQEQPCSAHYAIQGCC